MFPPVLNGLVDLTWELTGPPPGALVGHGHIGESGRNPITGSPIWFNRRPGSSLPEGDTDARSWSISAVNAASRGHYGREAYISDRPTRLVGAPRIGYKGRSIGQRRYIRATTVGRHTVLRRVCRASAARRISHTKNPGRRARRAIAGDIAPFQWGAFLRRFHVYVDVEMGNTIPNNGRSTPP